MFFNLYRSTKAGQKEYEKTKLSNVGKSVISPQLRLLNSQKRQRLKDILLIKFKKKYKIDNNDQIIDKEIIKFVQGEQLSDKDLQNLDNKIGKILTTRRTHITTKLNNSLSEKNVTLNQSQENLPPINQNQIIHNQDSTLNQNENNPISLKKLRPSASVEILPKYKKKYKKPQEELAELEAELGEDKPKKKFKRLDFSALGNEWYAIASYNKILYEKKILEEKKKELEIKKKMREELENQIKNKLKKKLEEQLKEKEEEKIYQ